MQRRTFLSFGLGGLGFLALSAVGLHAWPTAPGFRPRRRLKAVGRIEFPVLCVAAARVVQAPGTDPIELAHGVDDLLAAARPEQWRELNKFLQLLESGLAGLLLDGRPRPFSRLSGPEMDAALRACRDSRWGFRRQGYAAVTRLCTAAWVADERTWARIGYAGPPTVDLAPTGVAPTSAAGTVGGRAP